MTDTNKKSSDEQYWEGYEHDIDGCGSNHPLSIDIDIKFKDFNRVVYETKETDINCNLTDLQKFFTKLKKTIRMLDEDREDSDDFE